MNVNQAKPLQTSPQDPNYNSISTMQACFSVPNPLMAPLDKSVLDDSKKVKMEKLESYFQPQPIRRLRTLASPMALVNPNGAIRHIDQPSSELFQFNSSPSNCKTNYSKPNSDLHLTVSKPTSFLSRAFNCSDSAPEKTSNLSSDQPQLSDFCVPKLPAKRKRYVLESLIQEENEQCIICNKALQIY